MILLRVRELHLAGDAIDPVEWSRVNDGVIATGPADVLARIRAGQPVEGTVVLWVAGVPRMLIDRVAFDQLWGPGRGDRPEAIGTVIEGRPLPA